MRVLFVSCVPLDHAVTRYRCTHLAEALGKAGIEASVTWIGAPTIALDHDVVVLHRICANAEGDALASAVERSGAALVYGCDDLVFEADAEGLPDGLEGHAPLHARMLRRACAALVSTDRLDDAARKLQPVVRILPNLPGDELIALSARARQQRKTRDGGRCLFLSGSATHDGDLETVAAPLQQALDLKRIELTVVGPVRVALSGSVEESFAHWKVLPPRIASHDFLIAPLADTRFNAMKSAIKWQEAALAGLPTLASNVGPFADAISHESDGVLASGSDEWFSWLSRLAREPHLCECLATAARERVLAMRVTLPALAKDVFKEFSALARPTRLPQTFRNPLGYAKSLARKALARR